MFQYKISDIILLYLSGIKNNIQNLNWYISVCKKFTDLNSVT